MRIRVKGEVNSIPLCDNTRDRTLRTVRHETHNSSLGLHPRILCRRQFTEIRTPWACRLELDIYPRLGQAVLDSLISVVFTSSLAITLSYLWALGHVGTIVVIVVVISDLVAFVRASSPDSPNPSLNGVSRETRILPFIPAAICLVVGLAVVLWRLSWITWPESYGSDVFIHLTMAESIFEYGGYSVMFPGYSLGFHAILSSIAIIAGLDPYPILAYGTIVTYPISLTLTYFLCDAVSGSRLKSAMAAVLFPFVAASGALLGPQYMLPSTYAYTVTILVILALDTVPRTRMIQFVALLSYCSAVVAYPYMIMGTPPAVAYFWSRKSDSDRVKRAVPIVIAVVTLVGAVSILIYYLTIPFFGTAQWTLTIGSIVFTLGPTLSQQVELLLLAYNPLQIILLICGLGSLAIYVLGFAADNDDATFDRRGLLLLTSLYLVGFFLPVGAAFRLDMYNRPFLFLCMVVGAFSVVRAAKHILNRSKRLRPLRSRISRGALVFAVAAILIASAYPTAEAMNEGMRWEPHSPRLEELRLSSGFERGCPKEATF